MKIIYISHSNDFDFKKLLYEPLKNSFLIKDVKFIFPHENSKEYYDTKSLFNSSQKIIVLAEFSYNSTGRDIEIGMAFQKGIPIIGIYKKGLKVSDSQRFVSTKLIEYSSIEEIISKLRNYLEQENL